MFPPVRPGLGHHWWTVVARSPDSDTPARTVVARSPDRVTPATVGLPPGTADPPNPPLSRDGVPIRSPLHKGGTQGGPGVASQNPLPTRFPRTSTHPPPIMKTSTRRAPAPPNTRPTTAFTT